jgi:hypothetical protein
VTTYLLAVINGVPKKLGTFGMTLNEASARFMDKCAGHGLYARQEPRDVGSKEAIYKVPQSTKVGLLIADLSNVELDSAQELPTVFILREDGINPGTYIKTT